MQRCRVWVKSSALASRAMSPSAGCGHWSARASVGQAVQLCLVADRPEGRSAVLVGDRVTERARREQRHYDTAERGARRGRIAAGSARMLRD